TLLALTFSRVSLVAHEFVGHGGPAVLLGGTISDYRLYLFAGGRIHYHRAEAYSFAERLVISTGGITLELILAGIAVWLARRARKGSLLEVGLLAYATGNAVHAVYYLAVGIHYQIADGAMLHRLLGSDGARLAVVVPLVALSSYLAFLGAKAVLSRLGPQLVGFRRRGLMLLVAVVLALGTHAALTVASLRIEDDRTYAQLMRSKAERKAALEAARLRAEMIRRGQAIDRVRIDQVRTRTLERERPWPLRPVLLLCIAVACIVGGVRRAELSPSPEPWSWGAVAILAGITAISVALVWMLRAPSW
ncbi:MAG: hypothetical protein KJO07_02795, partial [Deltaproteobacteria bacterium]|nr:hypothetical protein [Deltaproteobacteria bacterium]